MSGAILTTSEMVKPDECCVVPTLGAMVAVLTDGYSNGTGIRVPVSISVGYPGFQYLEVRALVTTVRLLLIINLRIVQKVTKMVRTLLSFAVALQSNSDIIHIL